MEASLPRFSRFHRRPFPSCLAIEDACLKTRTVDVVDRICLRVRGKRAALNVNAVPANTVHQGRCVHPCTASSVIITPVTGPHPIPSAPTDDQFLSPPIAQPIALLRRTRSTRSCGRGTVDGNGEDVRRRASSLSYSWQSMDDEGGCVERLKLEGNAAFENGDWNKARDIYTRAIETEEADGKLGEVLGVLYSNRSVALAMLDRYQEALVDAEKTIAFRPDWARGYVRKAVALMALDRSTEARDVLAEGKRRDEDDVMLCSMMHQMQCLFPSSVKRKAPEGSTFGDALEEIKNAGVKQPLSVVVLSGFLGSGKTTLLNRLLSSSGSRLKMAVLVNDMASVNIDADCIRHRQGFTRTTETLVELTNGCVCCTLRGDLIKEATRLLCMKRFDVLVIESTGIGEPMPVAATFTTEDFHGASLRPYFSIQNMVTLVDGSQALEQLNSLSSLKDRNMESSEDDQRTIGQLFIDQIEFADVLLINKCDLISDADRYRLHSLLKNLNPSAEVFCTVRSEIDPLEILNKQRFRTDRAKAFPGFQTELIDPHLSETEEYGIGHILFVDRRPFHPVRLHRLFFEGDVEGEIWLSDASPLRQLYRSKGTFYLANVWDAKLIWSTAGRTVQFEQEGRWLGSMLPRHLWPEDDEEWDPVFGDREQKLVLIGPTGDLPSVRAALSRCLLTEEEIASGEADWKLMDQRNLWRLAESSEDEEDMNDRDTDSD